MPTVNVDVDTNLAALVYNPGDDLVIRFGAVLTMDSNITVNPLSIQCLTAGTFRVTNASPTDPISLTLSSNTGDFIFNKNGVFEVRGAMIELTPGNGAASQSWDFTVAPLDLVPYPSYVEVETSLGSGVYEPWMVVCTAGKTITFATARFSTGECGKVFFWDHATRTLSVGDGTNGNFLANGQKVRIPNVYFDGAVLSATPTSRNLIDINPTGTLDLECAAFSDAFYFLQTTCKSVRMIRVGFVFMFSLASSNGPVFIDHLSLTPDTQQSATLGGVSINSINGPMSLEYITAMITGDALAGAAGTIGNAAQWTKLDNCKFIYAYPRASTGASVASFSAAAAVTRITNLVTIGARCTFSNFDDLLIVNPRHADRLDPTSSTAFATYWAGFVNCKRITVVGLGKAGPASARAGMTTHDINSEDIRFISAIYDGNSNLVSISAAGAGRDLMFINCEFPNLAANSGPTDDVVTSSLSSGTMWLDVHASYVGTRNTDVGPYGLANGLPAKGANYIGTMQQAVGHNSALLLDSGLPAATGELVFAAFGPWPGYNTLGGAAIFDNNGLVELPAAGDTVEFITPVYKSVSSFINADPVFSYTEGGVPVVNSTTPPATMTVEFAVRNPGSAWSALAALTAANLAAAIAGIAGYDSDVGLETKILVTAAGVDATRVFSKVYWGWDHDASWLAPDCDVTLAGPDATDITRIRRDSDDSIIATFIGDGLFSFYGFPDFDTLVYFQRNSAADEPICSTKATPQLLLMGDNGIVYLYSGVQVQLAQSPLVPLIYSDLGLVRKVLNNRQELVQIAGVWHLRTYDDDDLTQFVDSILADPFGLTPAITTGAIGRRTRGV